MPKPFWVFWVVEFWERFGFYGMQAIATIYFLKYLGFSQTHSIYLWGAFFSFVFGFIWVGGVNQERLVGRASADIISRALAIGKPVCIWLSGTDQFEEVTGIEDSGYRTPKGGRDFFKWSRLLIAQ